MFAGLVATASSRSSSRSRTATTSPLSPSGESFSPNADRHAPSFASPVPTDASSPQTDMRRTGLPESSEFFSPFSVGGYRTPSTGFRRGRPVTASSGLSPSLQRSWDTTSAALEAAHEDGGMSRQEIINTYTDLSPPSPHSQHNNMHHHEDYPESGSEEVQDDAAVSAVVQEQTTVAQKALREVHRPSLSPLSSSHHSLSPASSSSSSPADTHLEKLARQRSPSSSSSSSATPGKPRRGGALLQQTRRDGLHLPAVSSSADVRCSPRRGTGRVPGEDLSSPAPVAATRLITSTVENTHPVVAASMESLPPVTPPLSALPLSPPSPDNRENVDAAAAPPEWRERSGTQESKGLLSITRRASGGTSPLSTSSSSIHASTPYAAPLDSPPDSAIKRPPGVVVVETMPSVAAPSTSSPHDASQLAVTAMSLTHPPPSLVYEHDGNTLLFTVPYEEEEHRVQLETQQTEERRCLFRAHKAVLSLYRMWTAEGEEGGGDGDGGKRNFMGRGRQRSAPRLIMNHAHAQRPPSFDKAAVESVHSSAVSTTERVQHFFHASIESARERRSGSAKATTAADETSVTMPEARHSVITSVAAYSDASTGDHKHRTSSQLAHASSATSSRSAPMALPNSSNGTAPLSPPASRHLDYSSMLAADMRTPANTSFASSTVRQSRHPPPPPLRLPLSHARLFSPWREDREVRGVSPLMEASTTRTCDDDGVTRESQRAWHGGGSDGARTFSPLIPHIRRTSPLGARAATYALVDAAATTTAAAVTGASTIPHMRRPEDKAGAATQRRAGGHHPSPSSTSSWTPSSVLSEAFLSVTSRLAEAGGRMRTQGPTLASSSSSRAAPPTPALVRSPRVVLPDTTSAHRRTPPWNTSPNLRSTAAASRHVPPPPHERHEYLASAAATTAQAAMADNTGAAASGRDYGFVPNNAFRQRQRATSLSAPSRSQLGGSEEERHRRERLSSYVQYKRFFDAAYDTARFSPMSAVCNQHRQPRRSSPSRFTYGSSRSTPPGVGGVRRGAVASAYSMSPCFDREGRLPSPPAVLSSAAAASSSPSRTWSPDAHPRRAIPHPTVHRPASTALPSSGAVWPSESVRAPYNVGVAEYGSAAHGDVYAARLSRLCTLEKLCRAELQRRWMEDQSALLHRFIVEGTVTLRRVRAIKEEGGDTTEVVLRRSRPSVSGVVNGAGAWTFIPNEMEY